MGDLKTTKEYKIIDGTTIKEQTCKDQYG